MWEEAGEKGTGCIRIVENYNGYRPWLGGGDRDYIRESAVLSRGVSP